MQYNTTNNSQSKNVQTKEVEPKSSLEEVPTEKVQQKDDKASSSRADIRNISSDKKNKDSHKWSWCFSNSLF